MIEGRLLAELGTGAAVSAIAGTVLWACGRRAGRPEVEAFGRQTVAWAAVDGLLAAGGWAAARRRGARVGPAADDASRARGLRRLLLGNAALDVGYLALGAALLRNPQRRGDGAAILVQGRFLLWLDTRHARLFGVLAARGA